jgi:hypothetical protein
MSILDPKPLTSAAADAKYAPKGRARLTVAAADSAALMKKLADYVCTGTGDLAVIQAAVDALPDDNAVSGEIELLPGNYIDATDSTVSLGSPSSASLNPRKVMRFHRGARINVSGRTARKAVIKVESPDCQIINPNIAGNASFGNGTGIAIGGDIATFGGRWDRVCNRVRIDNPIISNMETGIEFSSIDGGPGVGGSTGDCIVDGGYIFQNKTGVRAAGYTNTVIGTTLANNNKPVWVEGRRVEAQLRSYGITIVGWNEVGILIDGGFGSVFHNTWMEHVSATGSTATEAIRVGQSATARANYARFTGTTHVQLVNELYAVRFVGSTGFLMEDLVISTSGAVPSTAIVRMEASSLSKNNVIERTTFGPNTIPSHTALSIDAAAQGEIYMPRIPGTTGQNAFTTRVNSSTRASQSPVVRKAADTSKTSDTTLAVDSDMSMTLALQTNYALTGMLIFDANQVADIKVQFNVPTNATIQWVGLGPASSHTSAVGISSVTTQQCTAGFVQAWGGAAAGTPVAVPITGIVKSTDTFGSLTLSWAQNTSDATPTILKNGSWLKLEPIA